MRISPLLVLPLAALIAVGGAWAQGQLQGQLAFDTVEDTQKALAEAQAQGDAARKRAETLEANAASASMQADKTAQEAAAVAARIQQGEAAIAVNEAQIALIERQRIDLRARLAQRQRPVVQLTAALQRLSRRPPVLSLLRPGSLREAVYLRAVLETMLPEVQRRTAGLRAEIDRGRALQARSPRWLTPPSAALGAACLKRAPAGTSTPARNRTHIHPGARSSIRATGESIPP